jgi:hypothetical protein
MYTQKLTNFLGAYESLHRKLGNISLENTHVCSPESGRNGLERNLTPRTRSGI